MCPRGVYDEAKSYMERITMTYNAFHNLETRVIDLVEVIYRLLCDYSSPVNIGKPKEVSLKDFAEEVLKLTRYTVKIFYKPLPVDDPKHRQPDITKAKRF